MKMITLCTTFSLVALTACQPSKNNTSKIASATAIPQTLNFQKPLLGKELTKAQLDEIKKEFTVSSRMILPPNELVFRDKNLSDVEIERMEQELKAKDQNSYDLLVLLKQNCKTTGPNVKHDASFNTEKIDLDKLTKGDKIESTLSIGLGGNNCATDSHAGVGFTAELTEKNDHTKELAAKGAYNIKVGATMKNSKYAELLGARGMIVESSISGLAVKKISNSNDHTRALLTFKLGGSYLSLKSDIPYTAQIDALIEDNVDSLLSDSIEIVANMNIKMSAFSANLTIRQIMKNNVAVSTEYYLNGHPKTDTQIKEIFGGNDPAIITQSKSIISSI